MTDTYFFLGILLVPLMKWSEAQEPCPALCHCMLEILNCSRISSLPGFHRVPLPNPPVPLHPFMYLDFTGNAISSIGKEAWDAYPWAEILVLKDNSLTRLQNSSLEGLLSLTYLDLSCNKIQIIEKNAFEPVPFLQIIYLSGNVIKQIAYGTFRAWHGLPFLLKVDLSHNPLAVIQDSYFYRLPSLKLLDFGATEVRPKVLEDLLQNSLQLRILILPQKMTCCLCHIKEDIEVLYDTVKLECTESCDINLTLCEEEEPLNSMQEAVMKALEIRKLKGTSLLKILPAKTVPNNAMAEQTKHNSATVELAQNYSSLTANFNLLKWVKRLMQMKADEPLDVNWADIGELKRLYLLAGLLQAALKETIVELEKDNLKGNVQNELSAQVSKKSTDEATKMATDASFRKERRMRKVMRKNRFRRNQRQKNILFRLIRDRRQVSMTTIQSAVKPSVFELHNEAESWKKLADLDLEHALSLLRSRQVALKSSWKRSIADSPTNDLDPASSILEDVNDDLTSLSTDGKSVTELGNGLGEQILTKEELLNQLLHKSNPPAGDDKSEISAIDSEPSLNELLPDITLSQGTYWEHQKTSVSPLLNLVPQDDYFHQVDLFEAELNKQLTSLIPNAPVRKLMSHMIRVLEMDCTAPTLQLACTKLISRTGLLMKLFSENINETSSLWKSYFWPSNNLTNMTTSSSRKLEKPVKRISSQGIPAYGYGNKLLLVISVASIIMIIIAVICLIEMCSRRSPAKDWPFLGKRKKTFSDLETSRTPSLLIDKPLWLKDMYQSQDEIQKKNMADQLHDEESSEEVDIVSWGKGRPSLSELPPKKLSSKTLPVPAYETHPATLSEPPPPPPPPPQPLSDSRKPSIKKSAEAVKPAEAASSKAAPPAADEEDEEGSAGKSEAATTVAASEAPESGDEDEAGEEDEDEDEDEDE